MESKELRVMIADGDNTSANRLSTYLRESGFTTKVVSNNYVIQKTILEWRPHFLIIDLLFPGFYAQQCLKFLKQRKMLGENGVHVLVMSNHNAEMNVMSCLEAGADDFLVKPLKYVEVLHRLGLLAQTKKYNFDGMISKQGPQLQHYIEMIDLIIKATAQKKDLHTLRFEVLKMLSMALKAVRTNIIIPNAAKDKIKVIASSDDPTLTSLQLDLYKYPELQYVLRTHKNLFIESVEKDRTMNFVLDKVKSIQFDSMMVLPLVAEGHMVGALSIRMPKNRKKLTLWDVKMAQMTAQLIAITWKFSEAKQGSKAA
ncbi:MAG: response regulator [Bdellovibrionales bacterium]|nr:response regulator [Bdellovibrionales bacterium]